MAEVGLLYKSSVYAYLLIAVCASLGCYLLVRFCMAIAGNFMAIYSTMSIIVAIVFYLSPLTFARRDDTLMTLLPAKPVEKWAFYIIFCLVISTCVIQGIWYGADWLYALVTSTPLLSDCLMDRYEMKEVLFGLNNKSLIIGMSSIQSFAMILSVLYAILRCQRHRVMKGLLAMFGCMFTVGLISGITGFVVAYTEILDNQSIVRHPELLLNGMIPVFKVVYVVMGVYDILMLWLSYRLIAKSEVKG